MSEHSQSLQSIVQAHVSMEGGLLPCLHAIQKHYGYIAPEAVADIATAFNLSRAEVHGTISFYSFFKTSPGKSIQLQVCAAESCQAMGGRQLYASLQSSIAANPTLNEQVEIEKVYCLGNCACSPCARIADNVYGDVSADQLLTELQQRSGVKNG